MSGGDASAPPWRTDRPLSAAQARAAVEAAFPDLAGTPLLEGAVRPPAARAGPPRLVRADLLAEHVLVDPATGVAAAVQGG